MPALGLSRFEAARRRSATGTTSTASPRRAPPRKRRDVWRPPVWARGWSPKAEARDAARTRPVRGGGWEEGTLTLEVDSNTLRIAGPELLLIVRGPIVREYQSVPKRQRVRAATLEGGHRVHLHLVEGGPPLEVDPGDFAFRGGAGSFGPSLIAVFGWVESLRAHAPLDDDFRRLLPALAPERRRRARSAWWRRCVPNGAKAPLSSSTTSRSSGSTARGGRSWSGDGAASCRHAREGPGLPA